MEHDISDEEIEAIVVKCDPGIRRVVRLLNEWGFETTDSGDGVTKLKELADYRKAFPWCDACKRGLVSSENPCTCSEEYKPPHDEAQVLPYPHVFITSHRSIEEEADLLLSYLGGIGIKVTENGMDDLGPFIEASYDPVNQIGVIELSCVDDEDLEE